LTILRHADASAAPPGGEDFDRPLSAKGLAAARTAARAIGAALDPPQVLRVSPALRTRQTAQVLCEVAFPVLHPDYATGLYLAALDGLLAQIAATPVSCRHLMLVGHNPGLSELYALLSRKPGFGGLAPAQWVSLELGAEAWTDVVT
jgi:phosphohistidine phosphatase